MTVDGRDCMQRHGCLGGARGLARRCWKRKFSGGAHWGWSGRKLTQRAQAELYEKALAHFETLWSDGEFQSYDPTNEVHRKELRDALERAKGGGGAIARTTFFDPEPKSYQREMLDLLAAERELGRNRNLVVAATGTERP
ncbi:MAG: hypothetical protein IPJ28_22210 [Betaproteobacteria bacterium]|nr:hypothetical protein [Betaproteobacteria bacterium]